MECNDLLWLTKRLILCLNATMQLMQLVYEALHHYL